MSPRFRSSSSTDDSRPPQQKVVLPSKTNLALALAVGIPKVDASGRGPIADLKGLKNEVEIEGFRQAHLRDGSALVRYFSWLERRLASGEPISEYQAADKLEALRRSVLAVASSTSFSADSLSDLQRARTLPWPLL